MVGKSWKREEHEGMLKSMKEPVGIDMSEHWTTAQHC
jgi:hypothetical protein